MKRLLTLISLLLPSAVSAHHPVSDSAILWVEPVSALEVEVQGLSFRVGDEDGHALITSVYGQVAVLPQLSATIRAPIALVRFDDGRASLGNADLEFGLRALIYASDHGGLILSGGFSVEAPTGNAEDALGGGHWAIAPHVLASSQLNPYFILSGVLGVGMTLDKEEFDRASVHGAPFAQHAPLELDTRALISALVTPNHYISSGLQLNQPLVGAEGGVVSATIEAGWNPQPQWRISLGGAHTLLGPVRTPWRSHLGVATQW